MTQRTAMDLVKQDYWDSSYAGMEFGIAKDKVTDWIGRHLPPTPGRVFEIGCFPGRYLAFLGQQGWKLGGMDLTERTETHLLPWLTRQGFAVENLRQGDVLAYLDGTPDQVDLVCSFGFIEHFNDFLEVLAKHDAALKPGGTLIVTTPNFAGSVQRHLHSKLDGANLARHNLDSMAPERWAEALRRLGHEVVAAETFGGFDFWADREDRSAWQKANLVAAKGAAKVLGWLPDRPSYSPYCGIVSRKPGNS